MENGIFHQGLENELGHNQPVQRRVRLNLHGDAVSVPGLLKLHIVPQQLDLPPQGHQPLVALQGVAEELGQAENQLLRQRGGLLPGQGGDGIQRVEQEMGVDLALQLGEAALLEPPLHLRGLGLLLPQGFLHLRLPLQGADGGANLRLHQVKGPGGAADLVAAGNRQRRRVIAAPADLPGGPVQVRQRLEDAAGKHQNHQDHQHGGRRHQQGDVPLAPGVGGGDLPPLAAALDHAAVEQVPGVSVDVGGLGAEGEIRQDHVPRLLHRQQPGLGRPVMLHGVSDRPLQGVLALGVRLTAGLKLQQQMVGLSDRGQIVLSGLRRLYDPDIGLQTDILLGKRIHEAGDIHILVHNDGGLAAEGVEPQRHQRHQGPKGRQNDAGQQNHLGPNGDGIPCLAYSLHRAPSPGSRSSLCRIPRTQTKHKAGNSRGEIRLPFFAAAIIHRGREKEKSGNPR